MFVNTYVIVYNKWDRKTTSQSTVELQMVIKGCHKIRPRLKHWIKHKLQLFGLAV